MAGVALSAFQRQQEKIAAQTILLLHLELLTLPSQSSQ
jgi:hypothetical protein